MEEKLRNDIVSKIRQKLNTEREMSLNEYDTSLNRELQPLDTDNISYDIAETGAMEDGRKRFSDVRAAESSLNKDQVYIYYFFAIVRVSIKIILSLSLSLSLSLLK